LLNVRSDLVETKGTDFMTDPRKNSRDVFPATGSKLTAKSWLTEAPMRMLMNNLHPDVAENPHELVVYGGIGLALAERVVEYRQWRNLGVAASWRWGWYGVFTALWHGDLL
jgi:hypothetical protein